MKTNTIKMKSTLASNHPMKAIKRFFKTVLPVVLTASCFLFVSAGSLRAQAPSPAKSAPAAPAVDPATHAAHAAAGTHPGATPASAAKGDPALAQQLSQLQVKVAQLEAALAKAAPHPTAPAAPAGAPMAGMSGGSMPASSERAA